MILVCPGVARLFCSGFLFGGAQRVTLDGWLQFLAPPRSAVLLRELRAELDALLAAKVRQPQAQLEALAGGHGGRVLGAIVRLLESEEAAAAEERAARELQGGGGDGGAGGLDGGGGKNNADPRESAIDHHTVIV